MKTICLTVGKKHDPLLKSVIEHYESRLNNYQTFEFEYLSNADVKSESVSLLRRINSTDVVILLDERGEIISNENLIDQIEKYQQNSVKKVVFIIGGAYGVSQDVFERADAVISLSKLVFPHQIVRLLLVEQLYRSFNTIAGGRYHHN